MNEHVDSFAHGEYLGDGPLQFEGRDFQPDPLEQSMSLQSPCPVARVRGVRGHLWMCFHRLPSQEEHFERESGQQLPHRK
jgi:hypothetical protein